MLTRVFKSGNSMAVCIPEELAFDEATREVEIERQVDALVIRATGRRSLAGIAAAFAGFPAGFMADGRERHEQKKRD